MKELIIIVYKIDVNGATPAIAAQHMDDLRQAYHLQDDEELKEYYHIREIYLPSDETDVKIIYPAPKYTVSPEINDLISEISNKIKEDPTNNLKKSWEKLVRELKIRKLENEYK